MDKEQRNVYLLVFVLLLLLGTATILEKRITRTEENKKSPITGMSFLSIKPVMVYTKPEIWVCHCGNSICEYDIGETILNCPQDCFLP